MTEKQKARKILQLSANLRACYEFENGIPDPEIVDTRVKTLCKYKLGELIYDHKLFDVHWEGTGLCIFTEVMKPSAVQKVMEMAVDEMDLVAEIGRLRSKILRLEKENKSKDSQLRTLKRRVHQFAKGGR